MRSSEAKMSGDVSDLQGATSALGIAVITNASEAHPQRIMIHMLGGIEVDIPDMPPNSIVRGIPITTEGAREFIAALEAIIKEVEETPMVLKIEGPQI